MRGSRARLIKGRAAGQRLTHHPSALHPPHPGAADGYCVCYALGRAAFTELLGPIQELWRYDSLRKVRGGARGRGVAGHGVCAHVRARS